MDGLFELIMFLVVLSALFFCVAQVLDLMRRRDEEFPGRYDKMIWAGFMIFLPGLGALMYWLRKPRSIEVESPASLKREWDSIKAQREGGSDKPQR